MSRGKEMRDLVGDKNRCPKCGAFVPRKFIFLPGQVPERIQFDCSKCGAKLEVEMERRRR